jgi:PEP-CTERM motif
LLLFDPNGNLVAIASGNASDGLSSIIDFTVPGGDGGEWQTAITQGITTTSPINYRLQFQTPYAALSLFTTNVIGSGQEMNGGLGTYDVNANAGDNLTFDVNAATPSTGTELLLFDANGNLVAIAAGNGGDGLSSIIDFTVPSGDAGEWKIQVVPDSLLPTPQPYPYDLAIQGFSGLGPVNPSAVPEPSAWALLLLGFGGLGTAARLKKKASTAALDPAR